MIATRASGTRPRSHRLTRRRRGAVAVEMALTLTFLILPMLLGIWEIGCMCDARSTLVKAVREGGRQAATGQMTNSQVQQVVLLHLQNSGISTTGVVVTVTNLGSGTDVSMATQNDPIQVSATLPFRNVDWSLTQYYSSDATGTLRDTSLWYSAKDVPYTVPQTGPIQ